MFNYPIVGSHFRPPAKALLAGISQNTRLYLRAEPSNQYDENAIQVLLKPTDIQASSHTHLNEELQGFGKDMNDINEMNEWHLGYIPKEMAKTLRESGLIELNQEYPGSFIVSFRGQYQIEIDL